MNYKLLIIALFLVACRTEEEPLPVGVEQITPGGGAGGFFVLNEGNMGSNSASLDFFDAASGSYMRNIFEARNPDVARELGDVGNDLQTRGARLWAVINCSNLVEVLDVRTARHVGVVSVPSCRYIAFHEGFAYVSSYAKEGYVAKIDTASLQVVDECRVGREPEEMVVRGGKLYVANSGGYAPENLERTVSVIDLTSFTEAERIDVAPNLHRLELDSQNRLWASSREGSVICIDTGDTFNIACGDMAMDGDLLYLCGEKSFTTIDTRLLQIVGEVPLTGLARPYSIAVNPVSHEIIVTDAADYLTPGTVHCLSPDGAPLWAARAGNIPCRVVFVDNRLEGSETPAAERPEVKVFEYTPAPGQFINDGWSLSSPSEAAAWATERLAQRSFISLGSFGGYIVVGLRVENGDGADFAVRGNAFAGSSEAGIVWVARDENHNGLPDDPWHELKGSDEGEPYSVTYYKDGTWVGSDGRTGVVERNSAHVQPSYYPLWVPDAHTWSGTLLPARISGGAGNWVLEAFDHGYADNFGNDYIAGETHLEIPDELTHIDFIKVQTALLASVGEIGELSTEVSGFRTMVNGQ